MFEHALECRGGIDLRSGDPRGGVDLLVGSESLGLKLLQPALAFFVDRCASAGSNRDRRHSRGRRPGLIRRDTFRRFADGTSVHVGGVVGVAARTGQAVADRLFLRRDFGCGPERRTALRHRWSGGSSGLFPGLCGSSAFHRSDGPGGALRAAFTLSLNSRLVECPKAMHVGAWPR